VTVSLPARWRRGRTFRLYLLLCLPTARWKNLSLLTCPSSNKAWRAASRCLRDTFPFKPGRRPQAAGRGRAAKENGGYTWRAYRLRLPGADLPARARHAAPRRCLRASFCLDGMNLLYCCGFQYQALLYYLPMLSLPLQNTSAVRAGGHATCLPALLRRRPGKRHAAPRHFTPHWFHYLPALAVLPTILLPAFHGPISDVRVAMLLPLFCGSSPGARFLPCCAGVHIAAERSLCRLCLFPSHTAFGQAGLYSIYSLFALLAGGYLFCAMDASAGIGWTKFAAPANAGGFMLTAMPPEQCYWRLLTTPPFLVRLSLLFHCVGYLRVLSFACLWIACGAWKGRFCSRQLYWNEHLKDGVLGRGGLLLSENLYFSIPSSLSPAWDEEPGAPARGLSC